MEKPLLRCARQGLFRIVEIQPLQETPPEGLPVLPDGLRFGIGALVIV